ncbi:hypothetical protein [Pontibacter ramchanderi]|uniref:Uncharacterized protein n=1 Tax=Pontibacter ramchanderi TaxID=1179743 RepID=A0A2N3U9X2_9BACT|nr:hypothetical protein [Pontibacter ramchanderi]PKV63531.1 hypothetical protein BD749_3375 [Pontibacter ramchanderi]
MQYRIVSVLFFIVTYLSLVKPLRAHNASNTRYQYNFAPSYLVHFDTINYAQTGLLLPRFGERDRVRLQPLLAYTRKNLDALAIGGGYGANLLIQQHNTQLSFQYPPTQLYDYRQG